MSRATTPLDLLNVLYRHKKKVLLFFVAAMGLVLAYIVICPRSYESSAQLFVKVGRESVGLDATATVAQTRTFHIVSRREQEIASILEILSGRGMAEQVVNELGVDTVLGRVDMKSPYGGVALDVKRRVKEILRSLRIVSIDPISDDEMAINELKAQMDFQAPKGTTVVNVKSHASTPELAQKIVSAYLDVFLREHPRLNRTEGSNSFFDKQTDEVRHQLVASTAKLGDMKNELGIANMEGRAQILENRMDEAQTDLMLVDRELALSTAEAVSLKESMEQLTKNHQVAGVSGVSELVTESMRSRLYELELEAKAKSSKFADDHPLVRESQRLLEEAKKTSSLGGSTHILSSVFETQLRKLAEAIPAKEALQAKREVLVAQIDEIRKEIENLNNCETVMQALQGDVSRWQATYEAYAESQEQARIVHALEKDHISNINVVHHASLIQAPVTPRRGLTLLLGLLTATAGSIALAFVSEWLDYSLKSAAEVEETLELSVVVTMPHVNQPNLFSLTS